MSFRKYNILIHDTKQILSNVIFNNNKCVETATFYLDNIRRIDITNKNYKPLKTCLAGQVHIIHRTVNV